MRPPGSRLRPRAVFFMLLAVALTALGVGLAMVDQVGEAIIGKRQREVAEAARDYFVAFAHEEGIAPLARALDLRERLKALKLPATASVKVVETPPGPPVLATLLAEVYGPDAATRQKTATELEKIFKSVPFIVDVDNSLGTPRPKLRLI